MTTNQTPTTLRPAKPYTGTHQHQAIRAALRALGERFADRYSWAAAGWRIDKATRYGTVLEHGTADVVRLTHSLGISGRGNAVSMHAVTAYKRVAAALTEAGWTVEHDDRGLIVYGPGFEQWLQDRHTERVAAANRRAEAANAFEADRDRLIALLAEHDVEVSPWRVDRSGSTAKVSLTLAQIETLIAAART